MFLVLVTVISVSMVSIEITATSPITSPSPPTSTAVASSSSSIGSPSSRFLTIGSDVRAVYRLFLRCFAMTHGLVQIGWSGQGCIEIINIVLFIIADWRAFRKGLENTIVSLVGSPSSSYTAPSWSSSEPVTSIRSTPSF